MPGPFYFAWVNAGVAFNAAVHNVEDEKIVDFEVEHVEGDIPTLNLTVKNPRIGLLAPSRKQWAWLSWFNGSTIVPLFYGRLVGIPENIHNEAVTFIFHARPPTFNDDKIALAATLKVAPFYDAVWIDEKKRDDPDTVLEARTQLWHIDRVTHAVTVSDILVGEDGIETFVESDVPYDSVAIHFNQPPLRSVTVDGSVNWGQAAIGSVTVNQGNVYESYTGGGLISDWPKAGSSVGGGWEVEFGQAIDVDGIGDMTDTTFGPLTQMPAIPSGWIFIKTVDFGFLLLQAIQGVLVPRWRVRTDLRLRYDTKRDRIEHARFTLSANVQPIVTLPGEDESLQLQISSVDLGIPIDGVAPIIDVRRNAYFTTPRGLQSLEYLICLARSNLLLRSRCVEVEWQCRFERAIQLSLRKNGRVFDRRIPGGNALGKIVGYRFSGDGDAGALIGSVTIGCPVGFGQAVVADAGEPSWVETGWVEAGWQQMADQINVLPAGDVGYSVPIEGPNDDGLNFLGGLKLADIVTFNTVHNSANDQVGPIMGAAGGDDTDAAQEKVNNILQAIPTQVEYRLKPADGGPFETAYDISTTLLEVPLGINLLADTIDVSLAARDGRDVASVAGTT